MCEVAILGRQTRLSRMAPILNGLSAAWTRPDLGEERGRNQTRQRDATCHFHAT